MKPLQAGDELDHYRILELVARGGMASIFKAMDTQTGRAVAIKIPHPEAEMDVVFFDRFQREAEIGRELDHPAVVKVLSNAHQTGVYMAMEWIEGRPLRQILHEGKKLPAERATRIAAGICSALEYIHEQGVVHRDLKPENVMVDEHDEIKLIDFGIAGKTGARRLTFGKLSATLGTVDYISPEQVRGKRGDSRSDVYALGAVLYEMVSGEVPFISDNPFAAMQARLTNDPAPLGGVSPQLAAITMKAMRRNPRARYASAREFAFDLMHPGQVAMPAEHDSGSKRLLYYWALAAIPGSILGLLLYVAGHSR